MSSTPKRDTLTKSSAEIKPPYFKSAATKRKWPGQVDTVVATHPTPNVDVLRPMLEKLDRIIEEVETMACAVVSELGDGTDTETYSEEDEDSEEQ